MAGPVHTHQLWASLWEALGKHSSTSWSLRRAAAVWHGEVWSRGAMLDRGPQGWERSAPRPGKDRWQFRGLRSGRTVVTQRSYSLTSPGTDGLRHAPRRSGNGPISDLCMCWSSQQKWLVLSSWEWYPTFIGNGSLQQSFLKNRNLGGWWNFSNLKIVSFQLWSKGTPSFSDRFSSIIVKQQPIFLHP